eukprot:SAG31_NODE_240_length_19407_cov_29.686140_17_plen_139_part_00
MLVTSRSARITATPPPPHALTRPNLQTMLMRNNCGIRLGVQYLQTALSVSQAPSLSAGGQPRRWTVPTLGLRCPPALNHLPSDSGASADAAHAPRQASRSGSAVRAAPPLLHPSASLERRRHTHARSPRWLRPQGPRP